MLILDSGSAVWGVGHMVIVVEVKPPTAGRDGSLTFAQANGPGPINTFSLPQSLVMHTWPGYTVLGYIRHVVGSQVGVGGATQRIARISQLDPARYANEGEWATW